MHLALRSCVLATLLATGHAWAETNWPDMSRLEPGLSQSPVSVTVWSANIEPPARSVPPAKARWSGRWSGWACRNQSCDAKLIVEKVTADGANIIYGHASATAKPWTARLTARFVGDELQATLRTGATIAFRMRREGDIEFVYRRENYFHAGILSKDK